VVKYSSWTSPTFLLALQKNPAPQASVKERLQQEKRGIGENWNLLQRYFTAVLLTDACGAGTGTPLTEVPALLQ